MATRNAFAGPQDLHRRMSEPARDAHEALSALERLYRRKAVSLEEAQAAARLLTEDPSFVFPPPAPEKPAGEASAASPKTPGDRTSNAAPSERTDAPSG